MPETVASTVPTVLPTEAEKAGAGLRFFFGCIVPHWQLTVAEQMALLGTERRSNFHALRKRALAGGPVETEPVVRERLSHLMGIAHVLASIFNINPATADAWIRTANSDEPFGGEPPLARLVLGGVADLYIVRRYLLNQLL